MTVKVGEVARMWRSALDFVGGMQSMSFAQHTVWATPTSEAACVHRSGGRDARPRLGRRNHDFS